MKKNILPEVTQWLLVIKSFGYYSLKRKLLQLWKLLIDRDMKKKDLIAKSGISQSSVTKLGHNESVSTDIIVKICTALECDLTDIMELVPEEK